MTEDDKSKDPKALSPRENTKNVGTFAISSDEIVRTGRFYFNTDEKGVPGLDMHGDPRLEKLKLFSRQQKEKYAHITDKGKRERAIVDAIAEEMYKIYGPYSEETLKNRNRAENDIVEKRAFDEDYLPPLKDMGYGTLVCRMQGLVMCVAADAAGIKTHVVSSSNNIVTYDENGKPHLGKKPTNHFFVITDETNTVLEATMVGEKDKNGKPIVYLPILNGATTQSIVYHGDVAFTYVPQLANVGTRGSNLLAYGGHLGDGRIRDIPNEGDGPKNPMNEKRVLRAQGYALERYQESLKDYQASVIRLEANLDSYAKAINMPQEEKALLIKDQIGNYNKPLAKGAITPDDVAKMSSVADEWEKRTKALTKYKEDFIEYHNKHPHKTAGSRAYLANDYKFMTAIARLDLSQIIASANAFRDETKTSAALDAQATQPKTPPAVPMGKASPARFPIPGNTPSER